MLTLILTILFILCLLHYLINCNRFAKLCLKVPGPPIKFLLGNSLDTLASPVELFALTRRWTAFYNGIFRFYAYFHGAVIIYNPEDIEIVISSMKYHKKSGIYNLLSPWLQSGLLLSYGSKWQQRRKILTSAFHFNILQKYHVAIEDNSQRLLKILEETNGESINIVPVMSEYTLNTICETAMDTQLNEESSEAGKMYKKAIHDLGILLVKRLSNILLHPKAIFDLTPNGRKQLKHLSIIHNFTKNVIEERKKRYDESNSENNSEFKLRENKGIITRNKRKRHAMLDLLISAEREGLINSAGIQEEVDTFMFETHNEVPPILFSALQPLEKIVLSNLNNNILSLLLQGHDTTATGLIYCLLTFANYQDIQDKIMEELNSIFEDDTRLATMEDLAQMRYLDCCIKESLRLYPPVPFISRQIPVDTILSGYKIPAGAYCHILIYDLHRQEYLFKDALKFDPDRFLPENCVGRHNYAYIPFSAGPRNCIGQKFAIMEMKSALSAILRNYKLMPVTELSDLRFTADLVLRNSGPVYVKFVKRK